MNGMHGKEIYILKSILIFFFKKIVFFGEIVLVTFFFFFCCCQKKLKEGFLWTTGSIVHSDIEKVTLMLNLLCPILWLYLVPDLSPWDGATHIQVRSSLIS